MPRVLTIAGSDSGGGAGIQADLKTFAARGVYGMSVITAVTAQNTIVVQGVFALPAPFIGRQIDSVMSDIGADAIKIGMLANKETIDVVAERLQKYGSRLVVLDPVMIAKGGHKLLRKGAERALLLKLVPLAFVLTPNLHEARALTGLPIKTTDDMKRAAVMLHRRGARNVVIKGGHLPGNPRAVDILYDGTTFREFSVKRIRTKNTHGTGCTFASAIAAELAKGKNIYEAVRIAKKYITNALKASRRVSLGHGHGPLNHIHALISTN
ncbi:bifunctional hydroxymethylpyrimidine kinase/phosphomethylpyrimidine kinase [Candidatus Uhrbacteria bacterium]|nr:bifunctional hydroxymethylpyrimidine kinase/phosphomethylpyrimidine kinase [Candidatus Uhrbacteria bacterium]